MLSGGADTRIKTVRGSSRFVALIFSSLSPFPLLSARQILLRPGPLIAIVDRGIKARRGTRRYGTLCTVYTNTLVFPRHPVAGRRESYVR